MLGNGPSSFSILPPVVKNILIINGLFFLATLSLEQSFGINLIDKIGLHYPGAEKFQAWQFVTYMFMHGGFGHLFFNMFAVWMFGAALENYWGAKRFIIYYFLTGFGAAITHLIIAYFEIMPVFEQISSIISNPISENIQAFFSSEYFRISSLEMRDNYQNFISLYNEKMLIDQEAAKLIAVDYFTRYQQDFLNAQVMVGASGALFGILLAYGLMFPDTLIYVYFFVPVKAKWFVMIYGAIELFSGLNGNQSNVAHFAHLGGMVFGYIILLIWKKKGEL
jgi:membrane associated rhomboid family serine protease